MNHVRKILVAWSVVASLVGLGLLSESLWAANATMRRPPVAFSYPDQWHIRSENGELLLDGPSDDILMVFAGVGSSDIDRALGNLEAKLNGYGLSAVTVVGDETRQINGMRAALKSGRATLKNQAVQLGVAIIDVTAQESLLLFTSVKDSAAVQRKQTVQRIIDSIRRK